MLQALAAEASAPEDAPLAQEEQRSVPERASQQE